VSDRELAHHLLQDIYYDSIDRAQMTEAVAALHPDVDWSHSLVWPHADTHRSGERVQLRGRKAVDSFLTSRTAFLSVPRVHHRLGEFAMEGPVGSARSYVEDERGNLMPFTLWFALKDDLLHRYAVYPLISSFLDGDRAADWKRKWVE
jgi:hypothetical protein